MKIHKLSQQGDWRGVRRGLERGVDIEIRDERDFTLLAYAAQSPEADEDALRLLIDSGADVNAPIGYSMHTALGLAACAGSIEKARLLLNAGADVNFASPSGYTALIHVMDYLSTDARLLPIVELLVSHGADLNAESVRGDFPLGAAYAHGRFDVMKYLLDAGADPFPLGWTGLMHAIAFGTCEEVQQCLETVNKLQHRDEFDRTPWLLAVLTGETPKIRLLLSAGANINELYPGGDTALIWCAARGRAGILQVLIHAGADLEAVDMIGSTALMQAAEVGATRCVELLLRSGANSSYRTDDGGCAMSAASNEQIVQLLVDAGEDITDMNHDMRRRLLGLRPTGKLSVNKSQFEREFKRRFGTTNPESFAFPFWFEMVREGIAACEARLQVGDLDPFGGPVWCFNRFGMSFTALPDGKFVHIGGEHEDFYDPDFCIYNDVLIHERSGRFRIMGYPEDVFPPTDFHSATYVDGFIYIIGGLGYQGARDFGTTPVYRLDCQTWRITPISTCGTCPGWIYEHRAILIEPSTLAVLGGKICTHFAGKERHIKNTATFHLKLTNMTWTRA